MPGARTSPVYVGRATELARLHDALERSSGGEPTIVLLGGDAGVGKTRLLAEFTDQARDAGVRVLVGGCVDLGGEGVPYSPFLEALRMLGDELDPEALGRMLGETGAGLVAVAPGFARFLDVPVADAVPSTEPAATPPAAADQARLFELTLALLDRLGSDRPAGRDPGRPPLE